MKYLDDARALFAKLSLRERLMAVAAVAAVLYFSMDFALLGPQQKKIKAMRQSSQTQVAELATINKALAEMASDEAKGLDPLAKDRATFEALKKQVADADAFYGQSDDPNASQVGALVRKLLNANPSLTLVSLKTLPTTEFYTPPKNEATGSGNSANASANTAAAKDSKAVVKTIYKYGVEVSIKGSYPALVSYLENLQKYPGRLFWSEAKLDVATYPDSVLKVIIYSLSQQPTSPLR
jgi:MSHA biogenesis protein MshJ